MEKRNSLPEFDANTCTAEVTDGVIHLIKVQQRDIVFPG